MERTTHSFSVATKTTTTNNNNNTQSNNHSSNTTAQQQPERVDVVTITLEGHSSLDAYATNLELTGETLWYGSLNLCHFLISEHGMTLLRRSRRAVLELGSGLGRAGIVAAKLLDLIDQEEEQEEPSSSYILLTDGERSIMKLLEHNCHLNQLNMTTNPNRLELRQLWWGRQEETLTQLLNDRKKIGSKFRLILGADVLYRMVAHELFYTVSQLLCRDDDKNNKGTFVLAYSKRNTYSEEELLEIAAHYGLHGWRHDDYCIDIWDNAVDSDCLLWRDALFLFQFQEQQENPDTTRTRTTTATHNNVTIEANASAKDEELKEEEESNAEQ